MLGGLIGAERQWRSRTAGLRPSLGRRLVSFAATAALADRIVEAMG